MKKPKRPRNFFQRLVYAMSLFILLLSLFSVTVIASNLNPSDGSIEGLEQGDTLQGPGFFSGSTVQIDGTVQGTTFAAGNVVHVNGTINGSLFVAAQTVVIRGNVTGNVYIAGQQINVAGQIQGDIFLTGASIIVHSQAQIRRDLFVSGPTVLIEGSVPRHVYGLSQQFTVNNTVGGNIYVNTEQLNLQASALIEGDLSYTSPKEVQVHSKAAVNGETNWTKPSQVRSSQEQNPMRNMMMTLLSILWSILSALLVWFTLKVWRTDIWKQTILPILESPLKTLGVGLLALIVTPFAVLLLLVTVIGIPLGILLLMLYFLLLYLSHIVAAVFIGFWLLKRLKWRNLQKEIWFVLLGLVIIEAVSWVPLLDFLFGLTITLIGLGAFVLAHYKTKTNDAY